MCVEKELEMPVMGNREGLPWNSIVNDEEKCLFIFFHKVFFVF